MTAQLQETVEHVEQTLPLKEQLLQRREKKEDGVKDAIQEQETNEVHVRETPRDSEQVGKRSKVEEEAHDPEEIEESRLNKFSFRKGEQSFDIDEDAEFELKADGKVRKVTMKELRDYAAGGIAVRNRMRQLADEKKKIQAPFKDFSKVSKNDPLGSLKKVFYAIKEVDPNVDFKGFLRDLGNQVQQQAKMSPAERKAYELEAELKEKNEALTDTQRLSTIRELEQGVREQYDLSTEQVQAYGMEIMNDPTLAETVRSEKDLFDRIGDLADEVDRQKASYEALRSINSKVKPRDPLVFELSEVLKKNPDFDSDDLKEIADQVMNGVEKTKASQKLSRKQRSRAIIKKDQLKPDYSKMKPAEALKLQLLEKRKQNTR